MFPENAIFVFGLEHRICVSQAKLETGTGDITCVLLTSTDVIFLYMCMQGRNPLNDFK